MRVRAFAFAVFLVACSRSETTPAGPIDSADLTKQLPAGTTAPAELDARDGTMTACPGGKGDTPAHFHAHWKTFKSNGAQYIASYAVDLLTAVPGLVVKVDAPATVSPLIINGAPLSVAKLTLKCSRSTGKTQIDEPAILYLRADGEGGVR